MGGFGHHVLHYYGLLYWRDGGKETTPTFFPPNAIEDESPATRRAKNETQAGKSTNLHPSKKVKRPILGN